MTLAEAKNRLRKIGYGIRKTCGEFKTFETHCTNPDHGDYQLEIEEAVETAELNHRRGICCCADHGYGPGRESGISGAQ
jgi:hypothetical protein